MRKFAKFAFASTSFWALAVPAFAQDAPAGGNGASEASDIIVTARRRDESIQEVPLTVNAVSSETIEKLNIRDAKDIAAVVPGLQLNPGLSVTGPVTSLRGLNVDTTASGNNGTVEFYLNDAPISGGAVLQAIYDIGQVEVLRGPQGTLRGRASPSGSITVTTRRPDMDEFGGYVSGTVSTIGGVNVNGALNIPIIKDVLAVRVAGLFEDNEGNRVHSISNPNYQPFAKTRAERISVRFTPTSNIEVNASYSHLVKNANVFDQVESANIADPTQPASPTTVTASQRLAVEDNPHINHQAFDIFNWQAKWSFAGQRLDYVGNYTKQDLLSLTPIDVGNFFGAAFPGNAAADPIASPNLQNYAQYQHSYPHQESHELRLSSEERLFGIVDYVIGGFINRLESPTDLLSYTPVFSGAPSAATFVTVSSRVTPRRGRQIERSLFGNLTFHLGEATELSGGIRYLNYQENLNGPNNSHNPVIWTASLKHRFNDDLMAYATAGSSWRIGTGSTSIILARTPGLTGTITDPFLASLFLLTPETSKSYEIGFKSTWFDKKVTFNVSAFHQNFDNYIFAGPTVFITNFNGTSYDAPQRTPSTLAVGVPVKVDGFEVELGYRPNAHFDLGLNLAYAKSRITNGIVPCNPVDPVTGLQIAAPTAAQVQQGVAGRQVAQCSVNQSAARTPPLSMTVRAEYSHPITGAIDGFARGLLNFQGSNGNDPQNAFDNVDAYALFNLYLGARSANGAWEIAAYGKNLFNTQRIVTRDSVPLATSYAIGSTPGSSVTTYRSISMIDPREFGITARFAFGSR